MTCRHCHMGPIQAIPIADCDRPRGRAATVPGGDPEVIPLRHLSEHSFAGPDYSLLPDTMFPEKLDWMYEVDYRCLDRLTTYQPRTLRELRHSNRRQLKIAREKCYELLGNAAKLHVQVPRTARCGDRLRVSWTWRVPCPVTTFRVAFWRIARSGLKCSCGIRRESVSSTWDNSTRTRPARRAQSRRRHGDLEADQYLLNFQSKFVALTNRGTERPVVVSVNRHLQPLNFLRPAQGISASFGRPAQFRVAEQSLPPFYTQDRVYPVRLPDVAGQYWL